MFVFVCLSMYLFVSVYVSLCAFVCENVRIKSMQIWSHIILKLSYRKKCNNIRQSKGRRYRP